MIDSTGPDDSDEATGVNSKFVRLLLVEDDELIRSLITSYLDKQGYLVRAYGNSEDALNSYSNDDNIDVLLTDVELPGTLNGVQLANQIQVQNNEVGIVLMSGYPDAKDFDPEANKINNIAFLQKPFEFERLIEKINAVLEKKAS